VVIQYAYHMGPMLLAYVMAILWNQYGTHVEAIWNSHMETIWAAGCKPHPSPYAAHMAEPYEAHMGAA